jgi:hypothetical protein
LFILVCQLSSLIKIQHNTFPATAAYGSTPLAHSISRGVNKNTEFIKGRKKQLPSREKSRSCKWRTSLHNFSRKARVKTQPFFFISSLWLFIFVLPSNTVFVPRTPKRQVRDPTGVTAGSLRRATYNAPRRPSPHRQNLPSPESRSPASGSDQHRSNYGQTFLTLSSNLSPGTDDLFRHSAQNKSTELMCKFAEFLEK